jgi:hypothetical protein
VRRDLEKSYPWAAVFGISGIGAFALEVLKEWLRHDLNMAQQQQKQRLSESVLYFKYC